MKKMVKLLKLYNKIETLDSTNDIADFSINQEIEHCLSPTYYLKGIRSFTDSVQMCSKTERIFSFVTYFLGLFSICALLLLKSKHYYFL